MKYRVGAHLGALAIIMGAASGEAAATCLSNYSMIFGELQEIATRDLNGQQIRSFHVVLPRKTCVSIPGQSGQAVQDISRIQIHAVNATDESLAKYIGARVTVRGNFAPNRERWHTGDAVLLQTQILKVHDPRNNRAVSWEERDRVTPRGGNPRFADQGSPPRGGMAPNHENDDETAPSDDGDETDNTVTEVDNGRFNRNEAARQENSRFAERRGNMNDRIANGELRSDIMNFISDVYLKLFQMEPNEISEHYASTVDYFGRQDVNRAVIVGEKYDQFQQMPNRKYGFLPVTLDIKPSNTCSGCYDVSFNYWVEVFIDNRKRWSKNRAQITLDTNSETLKIKRETVEQLEHNGIEDLANLRVRPSADNAQRNNQMY